MVPTAMLSLENLSQLAASSLLSSIWQGILLAAGVTLFLQLVPKTTATIRFTIWTTLFLVLALLPFLNAFSVAPTRALGTHSAVVQLDIRWSFAIAALWALFSLVSAVKLAITAFRLRQLWKRATPVETSADWSALPSNSRSAQLCTSTEIDRPSVIGFFSPRILIPKWLFDKLTPSELKQIVLHELGHLNRADDWLNLIQKLALVLFPLNPALIWIEKRLCFEREIACDDAVLRLTKAPKAYATCLTSLAERTLDHRAMSLSLGAWEKQSELSRRVHNILLHAEGMSRPQAALLLGGVSLALVSGATGLLHCPQFISFSGPQSAIAAVRAEAQVSPAAEFHAVAFHPSAAGPRPILLKASMPATQPSTPITLTKQKQHRHTAQRLKKTTNAAHQAYMLTNWPEQDRPRIILTVTDQHQFLAPYAAMHTDSGWLVIQL
ncbi:beta-lactamase regulating signal transducer with metallopeptidase domain [Edaphobacter aggregans]|uniref:Beta-lactamase regulating signal transducer with metallopeptidase domain n=1 Tax=Edaphobacter aggregans TaxID=570835 RepID=A0A428MF10_9BACT|nr:M56 family metallopeptidase [Edaphobacter aggregans]RSL15470.1 beta-lactamase regulating signal transducer with metallopeptidase domain [Edaphobacter aggregans]